MPKSLITVKQINSLRFLKAKKSKSFVMIHLKNYRTVECNQCTFNSKESFEIKKTICFTYLSYYLYSGSVTQRSIFEKIELIERKLKPNLNQIQTKFQLNSNFFWVLLPKKSKGIQLMVQKSIKQYLYSYQVATSNKNIPIIGKNENVHTKFIFFAPK